MGDIMTPIPFDRLMEWMITEKKQSDKVFGVRRPYIKKDGNEFPFGPAAGPHTQLAQNIAAAYYAGGRFFELKTVQILDGEDLPVNKPCILAEDEGYNCEWSTELTVPQAFDEYVKAWFLLKVMAKEYGLGDPDGFVFNMSVGYDLAGIRSEKIDRFIEGLKNAGDMPIWKECKEYLLNNTNKFQRIEKEFVESISPRICTSGTLSTLHGCPPEEIEKIASYLLTEKKINTYVKCNPTLLGYDEARKMLDDMGYDYLVFNDFHFKHDLQLEDAVPMLGRLLQTAKDNGLEFGVKLTNTFPVAVTKNELPSEEMYLSGRPLFALSINVAGKLAGAFDGTLRISYSGGADYFNVERIFEAGIWPITMTTTLLKPGGYQRLTQIGELLSVKEFNRRQRGLKISASTAINRVDQEKLQVLCKEAVRDARYRKGVKPLPNRKMKKHVPLLDCFVAPCLEGCPIHQDIPAYMQLVGEGNCKEALRVILDKNPLPFITGTICNHRCMDKCTRNFYEEPVQICNTKRMAAEGGFEELLKELKPEEAKNGKKVAIVGGGPAGMAAAFFLARGGADVTLYEKRESLGGVVRHIIPDFRISQETVEKDAALLKQLGVAIELNKEIESIEQLKAEGFSHIVLAVGASAPGTLALEKGESINGLQFLETYKKERESLKLGTNAAVIGGGNTAMDVARAAKRVKGVENVYLVYRRDKGHMPADEEEFNAALKDGVELKELLTPVRLENGKLTCEVMTLSDLDASGRRNPKGTGTYIELPVDTVIAAVGEKTDVSFYERNGLKLDEKGRAVVDKDSLESSVPGVFVIGDGLWGPGTVAEGIKDASLAAGGILCKRRSAITIPSDRKKAEAKKGILIPSGSEKEESRRCLECSHVCECCVDVCPNRANIAVKVEGMETTQIIHVDKMCNECGNCKSFCPYEGAPYKDKFTLFQDMEDFRNSENPGFVLLDKDTDTFKVRLGGNIQNYVLSEEEVNLEKGLRDLILAVYHDYGYLF